MPSAFIVFLIVIIKEERDYIALLSSGERLSAKRGFG